VSTSKGIGVTTLFYGGVECGLRQFLKTELHEIQSGFKLRPHFPCARGPGILCLRRWVDASSSKNAMGQETFLSLLAQSVSG